MSEAPDILRKAAAVRFRNVGGEGVIVHQDAGEVMAVNATGAMMFELVDGERSLEIIAAEIADQHPDQEADQVLADVLAFADALLEAGALEPADPA